jgi:UDP-N-acetylglucosamine--N-acetylmuramyl-(pentapeptide) pyrophosphoryl-undecaprenol N-acetylglucosamine transferase
LLWALLQSTSVMLRHRPAAVLGMGGYVSGPGGLAAWLTRRPLIIHEQNAVAGLTNRLLARLARVVLQAFPGSFPAHIQTETVGNPVRQDIAAIDDPVSRFANRDGAIRLLVLGGSQGALALNRTVPQSLALLSPSLRPVVRHQAGQRTLQTAVDAYADTGIKVDVIPFIDDMAEAYAWADIVVCRAGALTVAEIAAAGLAAVFVPFPAAVDDHQTENARPMVEAGAAVLMSEQDLTPQVLADCLTDLLASRESLRDRAVKSRALAKPNSLGRITEVCMQAAGALS